MSVNQALSTLMTEEEYAHAWSSDSSNHQANGDYKWMSTFIPNDSNVLEIGCGSAFSTLEIAKRAKQVFSIEINDHLVEKATLYLTENGYPPKVIKLSEVINVDLSTLKEKIIIINADINDAFIDQLVSEVNIDFICCWLIGAAPKHAADIFGVSLNNLEPDYSANYRESITWRGFQLSKIREKINYHIVIRVQPQSSISKMELKKRVITKLNGQFSLNFIHTQIKDRKTKTPSHRMQYIVQGVHNQLNEIYLFSTIL
ncbi:rRNA adenine N-6-methyltransferase family protein [Moellerella wisconsensis]|uniref:rRNA adenine N-6-methyltransferase family protein n=1 Tax=Moellerella wisconsensis TaxID=158849 RepID=UPI0025B04591|nr:rRNA adenine N-6-methyltransferase family protein [Moellerella wisconsensis]WJW81042.1 rRNA adenine N-6-methyltransferase family protein [Moellerella wisconsensis]